MEASTKPDKYQRSSIGALHKVAIFLVVFGICAADQAPPLTLEDVRREIQAQLSSITASQLCSASDKICLAGPPGPKGEPGIKGRRGKKGYSGIKGDQGDPGLTGLDGMHGPKGDMGDMGPIGPAGMKGDTGYPGPPGLYGAKGEQGKKGYAGPPGIQGDAGMPGLTGMTGQKGDTGMPGYDGPKGEPGPKGDKGEPGEGSSGQGSAGNAPIVYVSPSTRLVFEGTPVTFNCYATGQPAPTIMWERVGKGQVPQGSSGALTIAKAQSWHSGQYRCRAFNMYGMKEATVELQVEGKPVIREMLYSKSRKITVDAHENVTLFCHVSGYLTPEVKWFKADKTDLPEGRTEIRNDSLVIREIQFEDSATYVCRAQNVHGSVEMSYVVAVTPRSGRGREDAIRSCKELKAQVPSSSSGKYWIDPDLGAPDNAFEAYCDQETDGGGWTLVWSYRFQKSNPGFMTPRPSFPGNRRHQYKSPLSTTPPLDPSSTGAMNFNLWKAFGTEMLLKSDLINWYICKDGSGSILNWKAGSISCRVTKTLVAKCNNTAPDHFDADLDYGMRLFDGPKNFFGNKVFYKVQIMGWRSYTTREVDACGSRDGENVVKGLNDPRGAWFVR